MLKYQEQQSLPPSQRLSLRDAFAWLVASSLHLIGTILFIVGRLLNHQDFSPAFLFHPIFFVITLNAWRRVRRGEAVRDILTELSESRKATQRGLVFLCAATVIYLILLLIPREETDLKHLGSFLWGAAYLLVAAILWKRLRKLSEA